MHYLQPQPGDIVVDPVCGSGATMFTPLLPRNLAPFAAIACDVDGGPGGDVYKAAGNYSDNRRVAGGVVNCDLKAVPMRDSTVDAVVADLPYEPPPSTSKPHVCSNFTRTSRYGQKCSKWNQVRAL